jgi:hypothetical protein
LQPSYIQVCKVCSIPIPYHPSPKTEYTPPFPPRGQKAKYILLHTYTVEIALADAAVQVVTHLKKKEKEERKKSKFPDENRRNPNQQKVLVQTHKPQTFCAKPIRRKKKDITQHRVFPCRQLKRKKEKNSFAPP